MKKRLTLWALSVILVTACAGAGPYNLPPAERLLAPGPGVAGPGPGVLIPPSAPSVGGGYGAMAGMGGAGGACMPGGAMYGGGAAASNSVQILFNRPEAMQVRWDVSGVSNFDSDPLVLPGRKNFPQGGIYRLKITNVPGREGVELYPTLEIGPTTPRTGAYLAHNAIPVQFTEEDFDQVLSGNFVTKVIYLPDPEFQEMALANVETLVSTRLDPGIDPIVEADRRGSIMAVVRLGNKDVEMSDGDAGFGYLAAEGMMGGPGCPPGMGMGMGMAMGGAPGAMGPTYISGVTVPEYGMPITGTPIGLPGPPHIPLGSPAAFQRHVMKNHTSMHIPGATEKINMHLRQTPGYSYPKPPSHVWLREQMIHPTLNFTQPRGDRTHVIPQGNNAGVFGGVGGTEYGSGGAQGAYCPPQ